MQDKRQFYINGAWVNPAKANDMPVIDPSTEDEVAVISLGDQADTDAAVAAAKTAFASWSQSSVAERMDLLGQIKSVYEKRSEDMAQAISLEMGAPIDMSRAQQVGVGNWHIEGFERALANFQWEKPLGDHAPTHMTLYEPIGVCALITPWNWPMNQIVLKTIPALATGCTMILKPSEIAPLSGAVWSEIMDEAGVPAGVYNMVQGDGVGVGSQLSAHKDVDMISFTGSTRAGKLISKSAADTIKRVTLELGGKGANIIFPSAKENAATSGAQRVFNNTGQSCNAPTRMLVHADRYDQAVEDVIAAANATEVGPASAPGKHIGPVVSEVQYNKIQGLIEEGIKEGARLVAGGLGRPEGLNKGYYVRPTVFADVTNDMTISREEVFGPVFTVQKFDTEEEAIAITNDTDYGLTNYIQCQDEEQKVRVARAVRSGMVELNRVGFGQGYAFGGYKQSGNGREGGEFGLHEYLETKSVSDWPM